MPITFEIIPVNRRYQSRFAEDSLKKMEGIFEVPGQYISHLVVTYRNGETVLLKGDAIRYPVPINEKGIQELTGAMHNVISGIKVYVDVEKIENDVDMVVDSLLGLDPL